MILSRRMIIFSIVIHHRRLFTYIICWLLSSVCHSIKGGWWTQFCLVVDRRRMCCMVIWSVYAYVVHVSTAFCFDGLRSIFVSTLHSLVQRVCMHAFDRENRIKGQKVHEWPWSKSTNFLRVIFNSASLFQSINYLVSVELKKLSYAAKTSLFTN